MILPKQPNERANPASASLAYLRISKDILRSAEKNGF